MATADEQKSFLTRVHDQSVKVYEAEEVLQKMMRDAVLMGISFTDLGRAVDRTEAAVRLRAIRHGWYEPGERKRGPKVRY